MSNTKKRSRRPFTKEQMRQKREERLVKLPSKVLQVLYAKGEISGGVSKKDIAKERKAKKRARKHAADAKEVA